MIKHYSMAKYKDFAEGASKQENMSKGKAMTEGLKKKIPNLKHIEVGINMLNGAHDYDVISYSEYETMADVKATVSHPAHDELLAYLKNVVEETHAVTYEVA